MPYTSSSILVGTEVGALIVAVTIETPPFSSIFVSSTIIEVTIGLSLLNKFRVVESEAVVALVNPELTVNIMVSLISISSSSNPLVLTVSSLEVTPAGMVILISLNIYSVVWVAVPDTEKFIIISLFEVLLSLATSAISLAEFSSIFSALHSKLITGGASSSTIVIVCSLVWSEMALITDIGVITIFSSSSSEVSSRAVIVRFPVVSPAGMVIRGP